MRYSHKHSRDSKIVKSTIFSSNRNAVKRNVFIKSVAPPIWQMYIHMTLGTDIAIFCFFCCRIVVHFLRGCRPCSFDATSINPLSFYLATKVFAFFPKKYFHYHLVVLKILCCLSRGTFLDDCSALFQLHYVFFLVYATVV